MADNVKRELNTLKRRVTVSASAEGLPAKHGTIELKDGANKLQKLYADLESDDSTQSHHARSFGAQAASTVDFKVDNHSSPEDNVR